MQEPSYQRIPYLKRGNRFVNPHVDGTKKGIWDFLLWRCGRFHDEVKDVIAQIPEGFAYPNPKEKVEEKAPKVSWVNHCTFLLEFEGVKILTDPIWGERCSPSRWIGPKRLSAPSISLEEIESLDMVLVSHNHYDHLDKDVVKVLNQNHPGLLWVIPRGMRGWFNKLGIKQTVELYWWEKTHVSLQGHAGVDFVITATPAQHFSGRGLFDTGQTLWSGFVVECRKEGSEPKQFYFVGDTGYNDKDFKAIGEYFGPMDLSMIPIGTYIPHEFMAPVHICPHKAVEIHSEVGSKLSVGMHWKTFRLSEEKRMQPPYDLLTHLKAKEIPPLQFRCLELGQTINW